MFTFKKFYALATAVLPLCLMVQGARLNVKTSTPQAQDGLFLDFEATPKTAGAIKSLLKLGPELVQNQPQIQQFYAFGYNGSQTNYSIFATYNVPNGQKASVDGPLGSLFGLPSLTEVEVIGSKVVQSELTIGLRSHIVALPDKVDEFKQFLTSLITIVEPLSYAPVFYALQVYNESGPTNLFSTVNFFANLSDLNLQNAGPVAQAFGANGVPLLAAPLDEVVTEVIAYKI